MLWALFAVDLEGEVRQTPFSALLPLCGIRHLSPGLSFPSGKTGAPKNKWREEPQLWVQVTAWSSVEEGPAQASSPEHCRLRRHIFEQRLLWRSQTEGLSSAQSSGQIPVCTETDRRGCEQMGTASKAWRPRPAPDTDVKVWTLQEGDHGI